MAKILPFKAVRPKRSLANLLASRPFYTYKKHLLEAKLEGNPFTFLHVINPEFNKEDRTEPNSKERFEKVFSKYNEFKSLAYLQKEEKDSLYIYRQTTSFGVFTGIIGGASVLDIENGTIKPHEKTLSKREETFKLYLDTCKFHAEPVLLSYLENKNIDLIIKKYTSLRPEYEFSTTDLKSHELWVINSKDDMNFLIEEFKHINDIYVADGHHRIASSKLYSESKETKNEIAHHFLSFFISEKSLKIFAYNRFIKSIGNLKAEEFITKIASHFTVEIMKSAFQPNKKHEIGMYFNGKWYNLVAKPSSYIEDHPTSSLDTQILSELILDPILGIKDLKTDNRVDFVNGARDLSNIIEMVDNSDNGVAFVLYPHVFEEIKRVSNSKKSMPPKSTWIEPKLRSGLTVYEL